MSKASRTSFALALMLCVTAIGTALSAPRPQEGAVILNASASKVVVEAAACEAGSRPDPDCSPTSAVIQLSALATFRRRIRSYKFTSDVGRVIQDDTPNATWDLSGVEPGSYAIKVEVKDERGHSATATATAAVERCGCQRQPVENVQCPTIRAEVASETLKLGNTQTAAASITGADPTSEPTFYWTVSDGEIVGRRDTQSIKIRPTKKGTITATVDVGGFGRLCSSGTSVSFEVN